MTALFTGLFLVTATILLVAVNLLLRHMLAQKLLVIQSGAGVGGVSAPDPGSVASGPTSGSFPLVPAPSGNQGYQVIRATDDLRDAVLRFQWGLTIVIIVLLTLISIAVGWWLAGRVLSPLHRITATARRLSLSNLDQRIALTGPRDELRELADTFDAMLDRLQRAAEGQRRFVANASHELRTPLAIQRAAIEIGLDDPTPERLTQVRQELLTANRRTERLIDGLLALAQGERGLEVREPVALDRLVHQAVGELPPGDAALSLDVEPSVVQGDPVLLSRLIANLLDNAVRYNRPGGTVQLSLSGNGSQDATSTLTVRNTGPLVPEARIGELFEPFRRLHTTRTGTAAGAGLGLSIAASIVHAHEGVIGARPNSGGGLDITVRIPAG
jgi:signal transduction histidine kinase